MFNHAASSLPSKHLCTISMYSMCLRSNQDLATLTHITRKLFAISTPSSNQSLPYQLLLSYSDCRMRCLQAAYDLNSKSGLRPCPPTLWCPNANHYPNNAHSTYSNAHSNSQLSAKIAQQVHTSGTHPLLSSSSTPPRFLLLLPLLQPCARLPGLAVC